MPFCSKCGASMPDGVKFCQNCGNAAGTASSAGKNDFAEKVRNLNNTADYSAASDPNDIAANKVFAILAYLSILVLVPIFAAKDSRFARYHANQGLVLLICEAVVYVAIVIVNAILTAVYWRLFWIGSLLTWLQSIAVLVMVVLGIVNAATGRMKDLPIIGRIRILK